MKPMSPRHPRNYTCTSSHVRGRRAMSRYVATAIIISRFNTFAERHCAARETTRVACRGHDRHRKPARHRGIRSGGPGRCQLGVETTLPGQEPLPVEQAEGGMLGRSRDCEIVTIEGFN